MQVELQASPSPQVLEDSPEVSDSPSSSCVSTTSSSTAPVSPEPEGTYSPISIDNAMSPLPSDKENTTTISSASQAVSCCANTSSINAGYKIIFDNVDSAIKPRQMRIDSKSKILHYIHGYALLDRIDYSCEPDERSGEANLYDILPSHDDYKLLKKHFSILVARIIVSYLDFFKDDFRGLVQKHIPHKHSKEMNMKSEVVRDYIASWYNCSSIQSVRINYIIDMLYDLP